MVVHACNPSTLGGRGRQISEFEATLVYRVSSWTARATHRNPVLKNQKKTNKNSQKVVKGISDDSLKPEYERVKT